MLSIDALAATDLEVLKSVEERVAYSEWRGGERVYLVHFDADHRLHWDDNPLSPAVGEYCPPGAPATVDPRMAPPRRVLLARPRVEELRCPDGSRVVQGLYDGGGLRWQRSLGTRNVIGRSERGLVTTHLEVWAPDTGEVLVSASVDGVWKGPTVPRYRFHHAALYRPSPGDFILYDPQPRQFGSEVAGLYRLYRLPPTGDRHELLLADGRCGLLGLGSKQVEDLRADPSGRYLYLLRRCDYRGFPPRDSLAVFDTATRTIVFEEEYKKDQQVVALAQAGNGDLGIALQDTGQRQVQLLRYRLSAR